MPFHEYKCDICGTKEEIFYRGPMGTAPDKIDCANCGQPAYRILSSFNAPEVIVNLLCCIIKA